MTDGWRNEVSPRFVAVGREVWDRAWVSSDGSVTAGVPQESVILVFDSPFIAREQADKLNETRINGLADKRPFVAACKAALVAVEYDERDAVADTRVRCNLLRDWVADCDGLDTL